MLVGGRRALFLCKKCVRALFHRLNLVVFSSLLCRSRCKGEEIVENKTQNKSHVWSQLCFFSFPLLAAVFNFCWCGRAEKSWKENENGRDSNLCVIIIWSTAQLVIQSHTTKHTHRHRATANWEEVELFWTFKWFKFNSTAHSRRWLTDEKRKVT